MLLELTQRWRIAEQVGPEELRGGAPDRLPLGPSRCVARRHPRDLLLELLLVMPPHDRLRAVDDLRVDFNAVHREPTLEQPHVGKHLRPKQPQVVGASGEPVTGNQLLGLAGATQNGLRLQHLDAQTGPGEIERRDQAIVTSADDQRVQFSSQSFVPFSVCRHRPSCIRRA